MAVRQCYVIRNHIHLAHCKQPGYKHIEIPLPSANEPLQIQLQSPSDLITISSVMQMT